jgi:dihydrofolate reductase
MFATRTFQKMFGNEGGATGVDDDFAARGFSNIGAWIIGRNMFGPIRGEWPDENWKGWWGDKPPYHTSVFVLTHHPRASITMAGGTTFHFITDGIQAALTRAKESANGLDIRLGGGIATIQQYLRARLIDEMHLTIAPILLGSGERHAPRADARRQSNHKLNNPSRRRRRNIAGIWRALRLDEKHMRLVFSDRTMLHAFGHYKNLARTQPDRSFPQLNADAPAQHQKKIVRVVMLVPNELALHFHDHQVMAVELPHHARLPMIGKRRQLLRQVDGFHKIPTMNSLGNGNSTDPSGSAGYAAATAAV